jgi:hypothetical protein
MYRREVHGTCPQSPITLIIDYGRERWSIHIYVHVIINKKDEINKQT